jgi:hypothetical protein
MMCGVQVMKEFKTVQAPYLQLSPQEIQQRQLAQQQMALQGQTQQMHIQQQQMQIQQQQMQIQQQQAQLANIVTRQV